MAVIIGIGEIVFIVETGDPCHHRIETPIAENLGDIALSDRHHPLPCSTGHPLFDIDWSIPFAHAPR